MGTDMPSLASTSSAASRTRSRFRRASARSGRERRSAARGPGSAGVMGTWGLTTGTTVPYLDPEPTLRIVAERDAMTSAAGVLDARAGVAAERDPNRFRVLAIVAMAQLMIVLDASVVTIALPSAQRALGISTGDRQWVLTAYTLAFGSLLLLGGRLADYLGRRRVFVASLLGFAGASALGGLSQNPTMLFGARALQGALAAAMAPSAL